MDIRALRYFQTVAECGSYSRGSKLLRISQPAVSRMIHKLEDEIGRPLFKRHGYGVSLTAAGRVLLDRSQVIFRQLDQTTAELRSGDFSPSGVASLAVPPAAGQFLVPPLVERFGKAYPKVFLKIVGGFSGYIHEWLVRGQVDVACLHDPLPQKGFSTAPLLKEEVFLVGKAGTFPRAGGAISAEDLAQFPLILPSRPNASRRLLDNWMADRRVLITTRVESDDHILTRALLRHGAGFSLLTQSAIGDDLRSGALEVRPMRPRVYWTLALVTSQSTPPSDIVDALALTIKDVVKEVVASGGWPGQKRTPRKR